MNKLYDDTNQIYSQTSVFTNATNALLISGLILGAGHLTLSENKLQEITKYTDHSVYKTSFNEFESFTPQGESIPDQKSELISKVIAGKVIEWGPGDIDDGFLIVS